MTIDTKALKALAKEALHDGSWWDSRELGEALANINGSVEEIDAAEYIAMIPPQTMIDILNRLEELEEREYENLSRLAEEGKLKVKPETVLRGEKAAMNSRHVLEEYGE